VAEEIERRTMNLWPDAGRALGLGKTATYQAAARGEIAGCIRIGSRWLVLREPFEKMLRGGVVATGGKTLMDVIRLRANYGR
jgi:hypothetical protein